MSVDTVSMPNQPNLGFVHPLQTPQKQGTCEEKGNQRNCLGVIHLHIVLCLEQGPLQKRKGLQEIGGELVMPVHGSVMQPRPCHQPHIRM